MAYFDRVQRASFDGIEFPVVEIDIHLSQRIHVHEYPHQDGGKTEKLGRRLYDIRVGALFDEGITQYPGNYPNALAGLRGAIETGRRAPLVLPQLGTVNATMIDFAQRWTASVRSGETASLEFQEEMSGDELEVFSVYEAAGVASSQLDTKMANLLAIRAEVARGEVSETLWGSLSRAVSKLQQGLGKADLYANVIEQRVQSVVESVRIIDNAIKHPVGWRVIAALKDLAAIALQLSVTVSSSAVPIRLSSLAQFTVPKKMAISDISVRLYGVTSRSVELLQINPIEDAFAVAAGTVVKYVPEAA